jgi:hypothetical protein
MAIIDRLGRTVDGTDSSARPADPNPGLAIKTPCRAATTANITLSGLQTVDGIVLLDAERVLVKNQTDTILNGIYNASSGNWTRAIDLDGAHEIVRGTRILVTGGTANALKDFSITSADPLSIGTSGIVITELAPGPELAALATLSTTGLIVRAGVTSYTTRSIVGTTNEITVTNGSGVSANPTLSLPSALTFTGKTVTGGTFSGITLTASDSALTLQDNGDATKQLQFQLSGITTATTRTLTIPDASGTLALTSNKLSAFAATTSAELAGVISDETGSGALVFANTPAFVTPVLGVATATTINKLTITAPASAATLTIPDGVTLTGPASSGTVMTLGNIETVTGAKTFNSGKLILAGSSSGTTILNAAAAAGSTTLTLPAATDTLVGKATTDTLTNKTYDTAGTGNSFSINGVAATTNTGTGAVVRAAAPTFTSSITVATNVASNTFNNVVITAPASTATLAVGSGKAVGLQSSMNIAAAADGQTFTLPATSATIARTDAAQTFTGTQTFSSTIAGNISGNAATVTTNANLTGDVTSAGNATTIGATKVTSAMLNADVFSTAHSWAGQQTLVAPILGTPASGVASNLTSATAAVDTSNTNLATNAYVLNQAASATPLIDGSATVGTSTRFARADHVHPTDTTRAALASPTFTGTPAAPTAAVDTNTTQLATTAMVLAQAASATPLIDGSATVGTSTRFARGDHVHPTDTTRAPLASPTFTGAVTVTSNSASSLVIGPNGATNPTLQVDASAGSAANGLKVRSTAAGGGVAFEITSSGTNESLFFDAKNAGTINFGLGSTGNINLGRTTAVTGGLSCTGALSKGSGTFLIDHPLDPKNKKLYHGFVEAPRYDLIYRGKIKLAKGVATVQIDPASNMTDGTFAALTQNAEVVSLNNLSGFDRVKSSAVKDGSFHITCENRASNDNVHWVVMAERADDFIVHGEGTHTDDAGRLVPEWIAVLEAA